MTYRCIDLAPHYVPTSTASLAARARRERSQDRRGISGSWNTKGTIGSPAIGGADGIRQLVTTKASTEAGLAALMKTFAQQPQPTPPKSELPVGSLAPVFTLPDLNGKTLESEQFNGNGTVLIFWNPACGFCQRMLPQLKEWEKSKPENAPRPLSVDFPPYLELDSPQSGQVPESNFRSLTLVLGEGHHRNGGEVARFSHSRTGKSPFRNQHDPMETYI